MLNHWLSALLRTTDVQQVPQARSVQTNYQQLSQPVFTLVGFVRSWPTRRGCPFTPLPRSCGRMPAEKFRPNPAQSSNRALTTLRDIIVRCLHALIVNTRALSSCENSPPDGTDR